jgi:hypothetical protein
MVRRNVTCGCVLSVGRRYAIAVASFSRVSRVQGSSPSLTIAASEL